MKFIGSKNDFDLFLHLIKENLPENLEDYTYVEPFGGSFGLAKIINNLDRKPKSFIYNDNKLYDVDLNVADEIHNLDYREILDMYDSENTIFYLDPPYYGKEHVYGMKRHHKEFHEELRKQIENRKGIILISYENVPFISKLYSDLCIYSYKGENRLKTKEILIVI